MTIFSRQIDTGEYQAICKLAQRSKIDKNFQYADYEGAKFSRLFRRQRELPFGSKLQNHALNHLLNEEFHKYFSLEDALPIIRDVASNRY